MHIGIIMDGNGRFATAQGLPRLQGHKAGVETLREIIRGCPNLGINTVTLFAFAIANWKRDKEEVDGLWELFDIFIQKDLQELIASGVRVKMLGDRAGLPAHIEASLSKVEKNSAHNDQLLLQIALNYDGVNEVARLIRKTIEAGMQAAVIDAAYVQNNLDTEPFNEPDIVIRTGMPKPQDGMGVWRSSAFLPIQSAQSVCISTEVLWPDFTLEHLKAIISYADPDARLFGAQRKTETLSAVV